MPSQIKYDSNTILNFILSTATFNNRLLYCHGRWSQATAGDAAIELRDALNSCVTISDQIQTLVNQSELDDAGIRARFFLCDVMESLIRVSLRARVIREIIYDRVAWGKTGRRGKMGHLTNLVISVIWL